MWTPLATSLPPKAIYSFHASPGQRGTAEATPSFGVLGFGSELSDFFGEAGWKKEQEKKGLQNYR